MSKSSKLLNVIVILFFIGNILMIAEDTQIKKQDLNPPEVNNSKRVYRSLILKNQLKVLLASDPNVNQSSASMDVHVGSLQDSPEHQGQFHFLEHMLFLGTKKYPVVGEYSLFLKSHNGYSNAYTADDHTNYHFEVSHDGLDGALDRFAQFFISPLFNESETSKEVNNVNSEHQKNIPNDVWRSNQVVRMHFKKGHPSNHFSTGDINTLKNCNRDILIQGYEKYYSSNEMALCILSNKNLDELEDLTIRYFSEIPNRKIKAPVYDENYMDKTETFKFIQIIPKSDIKKLELHFALPLLKDYRKHKSFEVLSSILGHEGKGTITSHLKKKGYITALSSGGELGNSYGEFELHMSLTPKGRENYKEIIKVVFAYIKMLKDSPFPDYYYNEQKDIALIDYQNREESEGTKYTTNITASLGQYELEDVLTVPSLYNEKSKETVEGYQKILAALVPANLIATLSAQDVEANKEEPYYKAKYSYSEDKEFYQSLISQGKIDGLMIPEPNLFIPKSVEILAPRPYLLISNEYAEIWYSQDTTFKLPKAAIKLQILTPAPKESARNEVLSTLYRECINEVLNEEVYPMQLAGLDYTLRTNTKGVLLEFNGYSDRMWPFINFVNSKLKNIEISEDTFKNIKEKLTRGYKNMAFDQAYRQAANLYHEFNTQIYFNESDKLKEIDSITLKEVIQFANKSLYKNIFIQGSVYGNLLPTDVQKEMYEFIASFHAKPLEPKNFPERKIAQITKDGTLIEISKKLVINNSSIHQCFSYGIETPSRRGAALVLASILESPYYAKMRTEEHLGYIVWSHMDQQEKNIYQGFIIQSGEFSADYLKERSNIFIQDFRTELEKLSEEDLQTHKQSVIDRKLEKPKTLNEANDQFFYRAFEKKADFDHVAKDVVAVNKLTKQDILDLYDEIVNANKRKRVTVLCYGSEHEQKVKSTSKEELLELKKNTVYRGK